MSEPKRKPRAEHLFSFTPENIRITGREIDSGGVEYKLAGSELMVMRPNDKEWTVSENTSAIETLT